MYENVFPASACWLNKSVPFGRVEPLHSAFGHTQTPMLTGETIRPMRGDANRRRTGFRPADLPFATAETLKVRASRVVRRLWPNRYAHRRRVGRIWGAWGDAWDPQATISRSI